MAFKVIDNVDEYISSRKSKNEPKYRPSQKIYDPFDNTHETQENRPTETKLTNDESPKEESFLGRAARIGSGAIASGISGLAGVPRNILDAANSLINVTRPEVTDEVRQNLKSRPELESFVTSDVIPSHLIPSSKDVKETIGKPLPEGYLNPRGDTEETIQEFASDLGSLLFPISGQAKLGKSAILSGIPNAAKFLTKKLGGSESTQEGIKLGTALLTSLGMQDSLKTRGSKLYNKIEEIVPDNLSINEGSVNNLINDVSSKFTSRGNVNVGSKKAVSEVIDGLKKISSDGRISLKNLISFKQDMNESLKDSFKNVPRAGKYLSDIQKGINRILKGNSEIPKNISNMLSDADNLWTGYRAGEAVTDFMKKNAKKISKYGALALLNPALAAKGAAIGGAAYAATPAIGIVKNLLTNPTARNAYANMVSGAIKGSSPLFLKNAHKLNESLEKSQPKEYETSISRFKVIDNVDDYISKQKTRRMK